MITIISEQPRCKYCGKIMKSWNPWIKSEDQAHPVCAGKAMATESINSIMNGESK